MGALRSMARRALARAVNVRDHEIAALGWAFLYFFSLLSSYYILRPVRDEMGIAGGVAQLPWLFTGTFIAMLLAVPVYGAAVARFPRARLLPLVYLFFIANVLIFYGLFYALDHAWVARAFFIWISVFNLFVVSVFWTFMADIFTNEQGRRLFGLVAAGGSAGAIAGPALTATLVHVVGTVELLPISAALLGVALACIARLNRLAPRLREGTAQASGAARPAGAEGAIGGGMLRGFRLLAGSPYLIGVGLYILLYTATSTFLYLEQAHIVEARFADSADRTALFAAMDLAVNALTVGTQVLVTGRLILGLGVAVALALVPAFVAVGFAALAAAPVLGVLVVFQVLRRAGNYAIARPAREVLFTVVDRESRYKAKNVIDTVVYRGGDAMSGWLFAGLSGAGLGLSALAVAAVPLALAWLALGAALGRWQEIRRRAAPA